MILECTYSMGPLCLQNVVTLKFEKMMKLVQVNLYCQSSQCEGKEKWEGRNE